MVLGRLLQNTSADNPMILTPFSRIPSKTLNRIGAVRSQVRVEVRPDWDCGIAVLDCYLRREEVVMKICGPNASIRVNRAGREERFTVDDLVETDMVAVV